MKYLYKNLVLLNLCLLLILSACTVVSFEVTSITINPPTGIIKVGQKLTVTATVTIKSEDKNKILADLKEVVWTNSDESIAELSDISEGIAEVLGSGKGRGTVTAEILGKKAGETTITAAHKTNGNAKASIKITVLEEGKVSSVVVTPSSSSIKVGETLQLTATVNSSGLGAGDKVVAWSSANDGVATVNDQGVVTGASEGQTIVTATSIFDNTKSDTAIITVTNQKTVISVSIDPANVAMKVDDTQDLTATVSGINLDPADETVAWSIEDPNIATIDQQGVITGVSEGETTVTATSDFDSSISGTATVVITSNKIVASVTVDPANAAVKVGETQTFAATVNGANLDPADETVTWSIADSSIATVNQQGVVTGVTGGETIVTATSNFDSTKFGTAIILVKSVNSVILDPFSAAMKIGDTRAFTATVNGINLDPADETVFWSVENSSIATVNQQGVVTAVAEGQTEVTAVSDFDSSISATATVVVANNKSVTSVAVAPNNAAVKVGETQTFTATVNGTNLDVADQTVIWSVADNSIATVDQQGVVAGIAVGQTTVTATSDFDGTKFDTATIVVTNNKSVISVTVDPTNAALKIGDTQAFTATVNGTNLDPTDQTVTWSVADNSIATVDQQGVVTAASEGQTTLTATSDFDNSISGTATVVITSNKIVASVTVDPTSAAVKVGDTKTFAATVDGANLDPADQTTTWSVADSSIATVDQQGVVTGVAGGQTTVTATSDFDSSISGSATIVVKSVNSIVVDPTNAAMKVGDMQTFIATVNGTNLDPTDETVTWSIEDPNIATIDQQGVVTGVSKGETTVTAISDFDNSISGTATVVVTSNKIVASVTVDPTSAAVKVGDTKTFAATVDGANLDPADQTTTWSVADSSIATVDQQGVVTGVAGGQTTVTATSDFDSSISGSATIVVKSVNSIVVDPTNAAMKVGDMQTFIATVNGTNLDPTDETVTWSIADSSIATVEEGVITALTEGQTEVTATSDFDGTKSATATVVVTSNKSVTSVTIDPTSVTLKVGDTQTFTATVNGANLEPDDQTVSWSIADSSIATVNQQGVITAVTEGQTEVTATSDFDGTKSATATVVVTSNKSVTSVTIDPTSATLKVGDTQTFTATVNGANLDPADETVTWSIADSSIATVNQQGVVTGITGGETIVTATSDFDSTKFGTATIIVKSVNSVTVAPKEDEVLVEGQTTFTATVNGENLDPADQTVTWTTADPKVATIDKAGVVTGRTPGETEVIATSNFDPSKSGMATIVVKGVTSVAVTPEEDETFEGGRLTYIATVNGVNLDPADTSVTWSVADPKIATVDKAGVVTGLTVGKTTVIATSNFDPSKSGTATIVVKSVTSVVVTPSIEETFIKGQVKFSATVDGVNLDPDDKTVTWSVDDKSIADIDEKTGVVTGLAVGKTIVIATSNFDPSKFGTATIVVDPG